MKKIFTMILAAIAMNSYAQDLVFNNATGIFPSQIPLNEIRSLKHSVDGTGNRIITLESRNGACYTNPDGELTMYTTQVEDVLKTGRFADMTMAKSFEKLNELEFGDFIGVFNEDDYTISEFVAAACSEYAELDETGALIKLLTLADSVNMAQLAIANMTMACNLRIHVADIAYVGQDMNGQKIPLSARLIYPYNKTNNNLVLTNIYIDNHPTVFMKDTEPTTKFAGYTQCPVCTKGYLVVQPDLIGYGTTFDKTQQYVDATLNGSAVAYSVVAAQQFATWAATRESYGFVLSPATTIINAGASQGATTALAGTYFMENKLDKEKFNIPAISDTRICAGAYDMEFCMNSYCNADTLVYACKMPMIIAGAITAYKDIFGDYTVNDYYAPNMKDFVYTNPETGEVCGTIWQMLDRKLYGSLVIEDALAQACPSDNSAQPSFHKMLAPDLFNEDGTLNWNDPRMVTLKEFSDQANFCSTDFWTPQSPIEMLHGTNDNIVPYEVSQRFFASQNINKKLTFNTVTDVPELGEGVYGPHLITCAEWYLSEMTGLCTDSLNTAFQILDFVSLIEEYLAQNGIVLPTQTSEE